MVSFGYFLPKALLETFKLGAVNVHPSLLPAHRGSSPIQHAIWNSDSVFGTSIINLSTKSFDSGSILRQTKRTATNLVAYPEMHAFLAMDGAKSLVTVLETLDEHQKNASAQDTSRVTHAPKITPDRVAVFWNKMNSDDVFRLYRAFGSNCELHTMFRGKRVQLTTIKPFFDDIPEACHEIVGTAVDGQLVYCKKTNVLAVKCMASTWIQILLLKVEGKAEVGPKDFRNGYQLVVGDTFDSPK